VLRSTCWVHTGSGDTHGGVRSRSIASRTSEQDPESPEGVGRRAGWCGEHAGDIEFVFSFVEADRGVTAEQSEALL